MKKRNILLLFLFLVGASCVKQTKEQGNSTLNDFVTIQNGALVLNESPYYFMGANYWYGMNIGMEKEGNRQRLINELDQMKAMGITNLRILASSEGDENQSFQVHPTMQSAPGKYNEEVFEGLDFLLTEMKKREMKAVMVLNNFWTWSGGMPQYLQWAGKGEVPYPQISKEWEKFTDFTTQFYTNEEANQMFEAHLKVLIGRTNSISGVPYKEDPTIMSWQLSNEPRGYKKVNEYRQWISRTAKYIKALDTNHLVSLGSEGDSPGPNAGINLLGDNDIKEIDYLTVHIWAQNWRWYNPDEPEKTIEDTKMKVKKYLDKHIKDAQRLGKPAILEEFGIARDNNDYSPEATTVWRDKYYQYVFDLVYQYAEKKAPIYGMNFWAYSGEGRPARPKEYWKKGDDFIGDPPHEPQGWYGVYDKDVSTQAVIKEYAKKMNGLTTVQVAETLQ
ncbi:cellulase family glycosylhydrolase [Flammeovirga sp. EKP202]|uniref:glycoside hydrolase 5 family protein n=1 Tax=Flammeovirga sp. EKP202 TaxID=2770592 RepID=UPI00165F4BFA|nr:cellulase family glycosylhydrolase [Flammeovirga sp. EKP202]MBD0404234.1 cellulase family glycosylhydrolase [Flammeovirga sp. EKP202]